MRLLLWWGVCQYHGARVPYGIGTFGECSIPFRQKYNILCTRSEERANFTPFPTSIYSGVCSATVLHMSR